MHDQEIYKLRDTKMNYEQYQEIQRLLMLILSKLNGPACYITFNDPCDHYGAYYDTAGWHCPKCGESRPYQHNT